MSKHWTPEQTAGLINEYVHCIPLKTIAAYFGQPIGAVNSKLYRLRKDNPKLKLLWRRA